MTLSTEALEALKAEAWEEAVKISDRPRAPDNWREWLVELFPRLFNKSFAEHHVEFWEWVDAITLDDKPAPFFAVWPRGGAKTTAAEAAVVYLAAKGTRKFCLYVRATQDKANGSVANIAAMLESDSIARYYPRLAQRELSKYGLSRGWRADMLRCSNGFVVVGVGLDAAVRGIKVKELRPDLIIPDDIDDKKDSLRAVAKKIDTLTTSILPTGSPTVAVMGVQNLMHENSIFTQIAEGAADFLYNRIVSGPYPAVIGLEYEQRSEGGYHITAGKATWEGQDIEICGAQINEWGLTSFLREAQHKVEQRGGIWNHIEFRHCKLNEVPELVRGATWVDPAVTNTDESDAMGIVAGAIGINNKLYRFYAWEQITSPEDVLQRAILKCVELNEWYNERLQLPEGEPYQNIFSAVGVETDQGGDVWRSAYNRVWERMVAEGIVGECVIMPQFKSAKAGAGHGSKVARNQRMLLDYEQGNVIHVIGTINVLERALKRFPIKPLDVADAAYWDWHDMKGRGVGFW